MATTEHQIGVNTNLQKQDLGNLDISSLTALSPEVISRQATINIGTIGHVAHGKSTVVKAISGVQTVRFKNELERNITIKLERLKETEINKLVSSPSYLKKYEERQKLKLGRRNSIEPATSTNIGQHNTLIHETSLPSFSDHNFQYLRGSSTSPSSGYGSICGSNEDSKSISSINSNNVITRISQKSDSLRKSRQLSSISRKDPLKRRCSLNNVIAQKRHKQDNSPAKLRRSFSHIQTTFQKTKEYVVEDIECVESINADPVFFVKWLGYPEDQNTWEPMDNVSDCAILEDFLENRYNFFKFTISGIIANIESEIEKQNLSLDASKLSMETLDKFEPLKLKADLILLAQFKEARCRNFRETEKVRNRVVEMLLMQPFYNLRVQQLQEMKDFKEKMNQIEVNAPINIENNVDLEVPEPGFVYIKESFTGKDVKVSEDTLVGCNCPDGKCAPSSKCCAHMAGNYFAYNKYGRLRIPTGEAVYECNRLCSCDDSCVNRVIQKGRKNSLCLFKTSNGCGWGVRTEKPLRKGEFVCEYVGEIITCEAANERGKLYDAKGRTYLFDLDYNTTQESMYTIDAAMYGNISHFINHSCEPNLAVFPYWINNLDVNMPGLAFFTLRAIEAGEELNFDYIRSDLEEKAEDNAYENLSDAEKVSCRCGAAKCRKVLF